MAKDVFVVQLSYWTGSRHMQGVFTTFEAAKTAMLIVMPYATKLETHRIMGDQELWAFTDGLESPTNGAVIERVPLSGELL